MLNSVSFGSNAGVFDKPNMTRPQSFAKPAETQQPAAPEAPKKKSKAGKIILGLVATAAAVAGLLVAGNKTGVLKNVGKYVPDAVKNAGWLQWAKEPVKTAISGMDKAGGAIASTAVKGYNAVKGYAESAYNTVKGWLGRGTAAAGTGAAGGGAAPTV